MNIHEILRSQFGYEAFRGRQEEIIQKVLARESLLVVMPTGFGKSLCFQIPSIVFKGLTLVVSPLIALMKDQVDQACQKGLKAAFINSSQNREEKAKVLKRVASGQIQLLYLTPERFRKPELWEALASRHVDLFVIDEAHCISEWGHDFRPDFTRLGDVRERLGNPLTLAVTATATGEVKKDILQQLRLSESTEIIDEGISRPNLSLKTISVYGLDEKVRSFVALHHLHGGPQIVYFSLISNLENFARELERLSIPHLLYHGQLQDKFRRRQQDEFIRSDNAVMLATPAFGLGINKPDIRMVIHGEIPGSIEAYYQEVGRAGRDGQEAYAYLFYDEDDVSIQTDFLKWGSPEPEFIHRVYQLLENNRDQVRSGGLNYMRDQLNFRNRRDFRLETALNLLERYGFIEGQVPVQWSCVERPGGELMDEGLHRKRLQQQQKKLLEMVQLTSLENPVTRIEEYFRA